MICEYVLTTEHQLSCVRRNIAIHLLKSKYFVAVSVLGLNPMITYSWTWHWSQNLHKSKSLFFLLVEELLRHVNRAEIRFATCFAVDWLRPPFLGMYAYRVSTRRTIKLKDFSCRHVLFITLIHYRNLTLPKRGPQWLRSPMSSVRKTIVSNYESRNSPADCVLT